MFLSCAFIRYIRLIIFDAIISGFVLILFLIGHSECTETEIFSMLLLYPTTVKEFLDEKFGDSK